jgi:hypothetical protein
MTIIVVAATAIVTRCSAVHVPAWVRAIGILIAGGGVGRIANANLN